MKKTLALIAAGLMAMAGGLAPAAAQDAKDWPKDDTRIRIVVPFGTGGSTDRLARSIASFLPNHLNDTPVTVVNKPGASGSVGSAWFMQQPADGGWFLVTHAVPYLANNILVMNAPVKWEDYEFINIQWPQSQLFAVGKDTGYTTLKELIEDIRNNPGKVSSSILHGSGAHLQLLIMLDKLGIPRDNVRWVTYQGGGQQRAAVAGGNVTFMSTSADGTEGIKDLITPLAIHSEAEDPNWPGVPLVNDVLQKEYGITVPGVGNTYASLVGHKAFREKYPERWETFVKAYEEMLKSEDYQKFAERSALGAQWFGPEKSTEILNAGYAVMEEYKDTFEK
ncbi:Bug family tripartite tricarboxylate transporter substrate binding protein [Futiania mangrovi]|uniref:Tripartite tricarboxylate transporter substrate-binding protein n=1 Tax=Futiania mangrovi TaxID=2959716 RepID=A0A9J6PP90_9PROT|nr:tripartite tricarboxylate transporter substrate-binding protein [Futiania mangrovii]MCP1337914.1 tripartite tricarboxylate transporter substrate-binding protein [Futiania mangrovii]